jgi:hypothetical protein
MEIKAGILVSLIPRNAAIKTDCKPSNNWNMATIMIMATAYVITASYKASSGLRKS